MDMDDLQPGDFADWRDEAFAADGSSTGFFSMSSFSDEYPRDGRGFEPSMLVRHSATAIAPLMVSPRLLLKSTFHVQVAADGCTQLSARHAGHM